MMKKYVVDVDITVSKTIIVEADDEKCAGDIALKTVKSEPYYHARTAESIMGVCVGCINEERS